MPAADLALLQTNGPVVHEAGARLRLLLAAADRRPVQPLTTERAEWFRTLRSLQYRDHESGFAFLAARQPALRDLETDVKAEAARMDGQAKAATPEERRRALWQHFGERLANLLGPEAENDPDPLLRTRTAVMLADRHLTVALGLPDPAEAEIKEANPNSLPDVQADDP